jgi:Alkyl sulfatase C-terminal
MYRMELSNGVLIHHPTVRNDPADPVVTLTNPELAGLVGGNTDGIEFDGNTGARQTLLSLMDQPDPNFAIVTRRSETPASGSPRTACGHLIGFHRAARSPAMPTTCASSLMDTE